MNDKLPKEIQFTHPPELENTIELLAANRREIAEITGLYLTRRDMIPEDDSRAQKQLYIDFQATEAALRELQQRLMEKISAYWATQPLTTVLPIDND